jgi:hypothetical protein
MLATPFFRFGSACRPPAAAARPLHAGEPRSRAAVPIAARGRCRTTIAPDTRTVTAASPVGGDAADTCVDALRTATRLAPGADAGGGDTRGAAE